MPNFYKIDNNKIILQIHLRPGAKNNEIIGISGDYLKLKIKAPAIEGQANDALIKFLATLFDVPQQDVVLMKGQHSRYKQVSIHHVSQLPFELIELERY